MLADEMQYEAYECQFEDDRAEEADVPIPVQAATVRQADDDERGVCSELRRMAKRKAWPPWAFPIAALHMGMMPWRRAERAQRAGLGRMWRRLMDAHCSSCACVASCCASGVLDGPRYGGTGRWRLHFTREARRSDRDECN